jgi:hypothetical protein
MQHPLIESVKLLIGLKKYLHKTLFRSDLFKKRAKKYFLNIKAVGVSLPIPFNDLFYDCSGTAEGALF